MIKTRFALAGSVLALALAGCGSASTTASVSAGSDGSAGTTPTATDVNGGPSGGRPQLQTVTGTAATKASAAALAAYPGTVQRVTKMGTTYVVDVTTTAGAAKHVQVSTAFKVTGLMTPPSGGPGGGTPPVGVQPKTGGAPGTTPVTAASS